MRQCDAIEARREIAETNSWCLMHARDLQVRKPKRLKALETFDDACL
jgi:hypothetical protein